MAQDFHLIGPAEALPDGGRTEVGNKAWNLMRMARAGLPVPPGFVLPTGWCRRLRDGNAKEADVQEALSAGMSALEEASGRSFGGARKPLLVSVRSGTAVSMPGMMETVLDVGLNAPVVEALIRDTGNPRLAWDSYRRFIQGYAEVVALLPTPPFDAAVRAAVKEAGMQSEQDLDFRALRNLCQALLRVYHEEAGDPFPEDPAEQLLRVALAVFRSWDAPKAASYRRLNGLDDAIGTAVTVQMMVFGNAGGASGAGVAFTRDPATGEPALYADFQFNGQGEDVVAGRSSTGGAEDLRRRLPAVWEALENAAHALERLFRDAQDLEFTVQAGQLFLLQARDAKRTPWAALRIAVDLVQEGLIPPADAMKRLAHVDLTALTRTRFDAGDAKPLATASAAGLGVAVGAIALDAEALERLGLHGDPVILVRHDTSTADIEAIAKAAGLLTAAGARTAHAAVVARQLGKVCLVGCEALTIDLDRRRCRIGEAWLQEGDVLSVDGNSGTIYAGALPVVAERPERELAVLAAWHKAETVPG